MTLMLNTRNGIISVLQNNVLGRHLHVSSALNKIKVCRHKPTPKQTKPLTYEMSVLPHYIAHRKSWNSWNTSNIVGGNRPSETAVEDVFIRRFMYGTWPTLFLSEIIIKRQHNMVRIAGILSRNISPNKIYFLTGYTEELLSYWLHCPVKVELVTAQKDEVVYKYI